MHRRSRIAYTVALASVAAAGIIATGQAYAGSADHPGGWPADVSFVVSQGDEAATFLWEVDTPSDWTFHRTCCGPDTTVVRFVDGTLLVGDDVGSLEPVLRDTSGEGRVPIADVAPRFVRFDGAPAESAARGASARVPPPSASLVVAQRLGIDADLLVTFQNEDLSGITTTTVFEPMGLTVHTIEQDPDGRVTHEFTVTAIGRR